MRHALFSLSAIALLTSPAFGAQQQPPRPPKPPLPAVTPIPPLPPAPPAAPRVSEWTVFPDGLLGGFMEVPLASERVWHLQSDLFAPDIAWHLFEPPLAPEPSISYFDLQSQGITGFSTTIEHALTTAPSMSYVLPPVIEPALTSLAWSTAPGQGSGAMSRLRPAQGTPEDSIYRQARASLNRGDYLQAADMFRDLEKKYPRSKFAPAALYWQAFALYRVGSLDKLREAMTALGAQRERFPKEAEDAEVAALTVRIQAALAARGDATAAARLQARASQGPTCDEEEMSVRAEALNALVQMDESAAKDLLNGILARRDDCSATLRRRAVYILGRSGSAEARSVLLEAARSDPSPDVRSDAVSMLGRIPGPATVTALEELIRSRDDERIQRSAVSALRTLESPESHAAIRRIIENASYSDQLRAAAISALVSSRNTSRDDDENVTYLRAMYGRLNGRVLKQSVINAVGRVEGAASDQWLLGIARNADEESTYRSYALSRLRSSAIPVEEVVKLYDTMTERSMRVAVINLLVTREEPAATDKLFDIARRGTDPQIRSSAINALSRRKDKDPRTAQLLRELVEKP